MKIKIYLILSLLLNFLIIIYFIFFFPIYEIEKNRLNDAVELSFDILKENEQGGRVKMHLKNNTDKLIKKVDYELQLYRCFDSKCYIENSAQRKITISLKPSQVIDNEIELPSFPERASNSFRFLKVDIKKIYYDFESNLVSNDKDYPFDP